MLGVRSSHFEPWRSGAWLCLSLAMAASSACYQEGSLVGRPCAEDLDCYGGLVCREQSCVPAGSSDGSGEAGETGDGTVTGPTSGESSVTGPTSGESTVTSGPDTSGTGGAGEPCDPMNPSDCAEGFKCSPMYDEGGMWVADRVCVPAGPDAEGQPCMHAGPMQGDTCEAGLICVVDAMLENPPTADSGMGYCMRTCETQAQCDQAGAGLGCEPLVEGTISVCVVHGSCDPLVDDCDQDEFSCVINPDTNSACLPGAQQPGNSCWLPRHCFSGEVCVSGSEVPGCTAGSCCAPLCDLGLGGSDCPTGTCVEVYGGGSAPPGLESVGYCSGGDGDGDGPPCGADCGLLLHFEGLDNGSEFYDASPNGFTLFGLGSGLQLTNLFARFGPKGMRNGGSVGIGLPTEAALVLSSDFTVDFWFRTDTLGEAILYAAGEPDMTTPEFIISYGAPADSIVTGAPDGLIAVQLPGGVPQLLLSDGGIDDDLWHHVAVTRDTGTVRLFVDGTEQGSSMWSATISAVGGRLMSSENGADYDVDELRIRPTTAEWGSGFTPPTGPYTVP